MAHRVSPPGRRRGKRHGHSPLVQPRRRGPHMSYVDGAATAAQLQSFGSTFTALTQELAQTSPSGGFQDVLAQMRSALSSLNGTPASSASASSGPAALMSTASMFGAPTPAEDTGTAT